jgi:hypothetical protein
LDGNLEYSLTRQKLFPKISGGVVLKDMSFQLASKKLVEKRKTPSTLDATKEAEIENSALGEHQPENFYPGLEYLQTETVPSNTKGTTDHKTK